MAECTNIFRAVVQQWRATPALAGIPIDTTRPTEGELGGSTFPYCHLEARALSHRYFSGNCRLSWYEVVLTVYAGGKQVANDTSDLIEALFDRNIGLPSATFDTCVCLECRAMPESVDVDPSDFYGSDVNDLRHVYNVLLNEAVPVIRSAVAN